MGASVLTDVQVKSARPRDKAYKMADSGGLFLFVTPAGGKSWRWKYRFHGKERQLVIGRYPDMAVREARRIRDEADKLRRGGQDPSFAKAEAKVRAHADQDQTFEAIALIWHDKQKRRWRAKHSANVLRSLKNDVFPAIGSRPIGTIKAPSILALLRKVEERGAHDQAHRLRQRIEAIFAMAIGMGVAEANPAVMVTKALEPVTIGRYPAVRSIDDARALLQAVEALPAHPVMRLANRLIALTACRSEAVRFAEWPEFDLTGTNPHWRVPAAHMKGQRAQREDEEFDLIIPLPPQAIEVVETVKALSGNGKLVFPGARDPRRPMSDSTLSAMYRRIPEFAGRHVPHGWRSTFSTVMNEWAQEHGRAGDGEVIDLMLAHVRQGVEGIYNRAAYMPRRRELAQKWADMLLKHMPAATNLIGGEA